MERDAMQLCIWSAAAVLLCAAPHPSSAQAVPENDRVRSAFHDSLRSRTERAAEHAQAPRVSPAAVTRVAREQDRPHLRVPPVDLFELSRYAGWGGAIGAGFGLAYGLVFERGPLWQVEVIADTVAGFTVGVVGGMAVYLVKLALPSG